MKIKFIVQGILIAFLNIFAINTSFAQTYVYSDNTNILPEPIEIDDKEFQESIYSYFNKNNLLTIAGRTDIFRPVIDSKITVSQSDPLNLKVDVILTNKTRDWYIPRFEEKTFFSRNKIVLMGDGGKISVSYPDWWPVQPRDADERFVLRPQPPEHIGMFAKFNKGDTYKLEYKVIIPKSEEEEFSFDVFYQDFAMPTEIYIKYQESNEELNIANLTTKSNVVKVKCKKKEKDESDGYMCEFSN